MQSKSICLCETEDYCTPTWSPTNKYCTALLLVGRQISPSEYRIRPFELKIWNEGQQARQFISWTQWQAVGFGNVMYHGGIMASYNVWFSHQCHKAYQYLILIGKHHRHKTSLTGWRGKTHVAAVSLCYAWICELSQLDPSWSVEQSHDCNAFLVQKRQNNWTCSSRPLWPAPSMLRNSNKTADTLLLLLLWLMHVYCWTGCSCCFWGPIADSVSDAVAAAYAAVDLAVSCSNPAVKQHITP